MKYLKGVGFEKVYLVSDHENFYEKYGFVEIGKVMAPWGAEEKIYMHDVQRLGNIKIHEGKQQQPIGEIPVGCLKEHLLEIQEQVKKVYIHPKVSEYIVELSQATRTHEQIQLGLSTRASIAVARMARAEAYMKGRNFVIPDDVREIFSDVARHRIKMAHQTRMKQISTDQVIHEILTRVKMPRPEDKYEK